MWVIFKESKIGEKCPFPGGCSGKLVLNQIGGMVFVECNRSPHHWRLATSEEIESSKKEKEATRA